MKWHAQIRSWRQVPRSDITAVTVRSGPSALWGMVGLFLVGMAHGVPGTAQQAAFPCSGPNGQAGSSLTPGGFCYYALPMDEFCLDLMSEEDVQICLPPISDGSGSGSGSGSATGAGPGVGVYGPGGVLQNLAQGLATGTLKPTNPAALQEVRDRVVRYLYAIAEMERLEGRQRTAQLVRWEEGRAPEARPRPTTSQAMAPAPANARDAQARNTPAGQPRPPAEAIRVDPAVAQFAAWLDRESRSRPPARPR
jgi:hypothetical protein